jgi:hypothetical protein
MTRRGVRLALFLVFLAALSFTGWFVFDSWQRLGRERLSLDDFDASARRVATTLADARAGIQAYVAVGQGDAFWRTRVAGDLDTLNQELGTLRQLAREASALNDLDAAAAALDNLAAIDDRAGRLVRNGHLTLASETIFGEGLETLASAGTRVEDAWKAERAAAGLRTRALEQQLGLALSGAGAAAVLVSILLLPVGRIPESVRPQTPSARLTTLALDPPRPATPSTSMEPRQAEPSAAAAAPPAPAAAAATNDGVGAPPRDRRKAAELKATADLCTDFARLLDTQELPSLLERAARLIDAQGLIVWVGDPDGTELRPALAHGYGARAIARMPTIPRNADNATAAAWRDAGMQVVVTNGMSPGALVTPLMTPTGCVGVLAAETRLGRESSESTRALARIIAAQIATLVSVPSAEPVAEPADTVAQVHS